MTEIQSEREISGVSMQSGRVKKQMETDQTK